MTPRRPASARNAIAAVMCLPLLAACTRAAAVTASDAASGVTPVTTTAKSDYPNYPNYPGGSSPRSAAAPVPRLEAGVMARRAFGVPGDATTRRRLVVTLTPPVTDPSALPVLYLLHGLPGRATDLCNPTASAELLDSFRAGVPPFITACPDGNTSGDGDSEWADSADGKAGLETLLTKTAIAAVEGTHVRSSRMRAIGGFSMGGFGAAAIALRHRDLYRQVLTFAGYFSVDDPNQVFGPGGASQLLHNPRELVDNARGSRWYLAEASQDSLALTAHAAEGFAPSLRAVGATVRLVVSNGTHSPGWALAQLPDAATFLGAGWGA